MPTIEIDILQATLESLWGRKHMDNEGIHFLYEANDQLFYFVSDLEYSSYIYRMEKNFGTEMVLQRYVGNPQKVDLVHAKTVILALAVVSRDDAFREHLQKISVALNGEIGEVKEIID